MAEPTSELTAVLLCGGKGQRLKPFTEALPKALVPLNGRPLLAHLLNYLAAAGIGRAVVCVGYKAEAIEQFVREFGRECKDPGLTITCVNSGDASMTDRILDARKAVAGQALVCYGDTLANVDVAALRRAHEASSALATLTVYPLHSPFGIVNFDASGRVVEFIEKPRLPYWINIGFLLCEPGALDAIEPKSDLPEFLSALARAGRLHAYQHAGQHLTVNTEKDRQQAEGQMVEFYTDMEGHKR